MDYRFRYCPNCSKPINQKGRKSIECASCGFTFYFSPASTNALIIENDKGEILLTKRKFEPRKGYWDLPGGFVELGETVEESTIREIKEELGLDIKDIKYFGSYISVYPYKGIDYQTLCHAYTAKYKGGKIKINDDVSGYKFFPKEEIQLDNLSFDDIKGALKDFIG